MNLGPLLTAVGLAAITSEARITARKNHIAVSVATGLLFATAAGFALWALTGWLAGELGTTGALILVATGLALLGFSIQGLASLLDKRHSKSSQLPRPVADLAKALEAGGHPSSDLMAVAVVALVGFLLARQVGRS
jgi:hypothetical protein